jgi:hypothetical protein
MWCSTCQHDSAGLPSLDGSGIIRCAQCQSVLAHGTPAAFEQGACEGLAAPPWIEEDWELEADIRSVHRLVDRLGAGSRVDAASLTGGPHFAPAAHAPQAEPVARRESPVSRSNPLAWLLLSLGLATFACGAVLLGWSLAAGRDDLWPLGMPLALAGQAGLILGLVLQLESLWHSNRETTRTLSALDEELNRVRQTATLLTTSQNTSVQTFYTHLAEGAAPQLLLADLKGQLDLLARQLSQRA